MSDLVRHHRDPKASCRLLEFSKELGPCESPDAVTSRLAGQYCHDESRSKLFSLVPTLERWGRPLGNNKKLQCVVIPSLYDSTLEVEHLVIIQRHLH